MDETPILYKVQARKTIGINFQDNEVETINQAIQLIPNENRTTARNTFLEICRQFIELKNQNPTLTENDEDGDAVIEMWKNLANSNGEIATQLQTQIDDLKSDNAILTERLATGHTPQPTPTAVNTDNPPTPNPSNPVLTLNLTQKEAHLLNETSRKLKISIKAMLIERMFTPYIYNGALDFFTIPFKRDRLREIDQHFQ